MPASDCRDICTTGVGIPEPRPAAKYGWLIALENPATLAQANLDFFAGG